MIRGLARSSDRSCLDGNDMLRISLTIAVVCSLSMLARGTLWASDHLLTIGGGPRPESNQISLENNVRYLQRVLERLNISDIHQKILFSDGGDVQTDLQFDAQRDPEDLRMLLADLIGPANGVNFDYRTSLLPVVDGAADPTTIENTLKDFRAQLAGGDRLIVYFTGHGGKARGESSSSRGPFPRSGNEPVMNTPASARPTRMEPSNSSESKSDESSKPEDSAKPEAVVEAETSNKESVSDSSKTGADAEREPRPADRQRPEGGNRKPAFANNIMHLWKSTDMSVTEWTEKLDELSPDVPVVAVMVQCYSGGFGNFIFKKGNPANGLAEHPRCGFFSTVPDRVAAGCTPNINEADYREYSSYFFEALCGESRTGQSVTSPDYDQDGRTSFLEAHAYTVLTARTIDIPVRTTDIFLRHASKTKGQDGLLTPNSPVDELVKHATIVEKSVIEGLSREFLLTGTDRADDVEKAIRQKRDEKARTDSEVRRRRTTVSSIKREIGAAVKKRWPVMASPWHPETARLISEEADAVRQVIVEHPRYAEMKKELATIKQLSKESEQKELDVVKLERLKYWLETVVLSANLKLMEDTANLAALSRIAELESTFLTKTEPVAKPAT
ncbi:hypothetical protein A6X21_21660 [Planctopirus hydrillae]|uniref:Uncharacterized protein n=2 Tax=Planctopirus hydrillae TaxID=1841610 RepID=A0A1C3EFX8_9PLAN|nr:hypothetical protein A6X21_21660 [Planctopirus hydrillae]